jgi:hypothetical protein
MPNLLFDLCGDDGDLGPLAALEVFQVGACLLGSVCHGAFLWCIMQRQSVILFWRGRPLFRFLMSRG